MHSPLQIRLRWFILIAGLIASGATILGFMGRYSWYFDLFSHFRVQYMVGLFVLALISWIGRRRRESTILFAFGCLNLIQVLPLYVDKPEKPAHSSVQMRAMLFNINTNNGDANRVLNEIHRIDPDILVLQEISARWVSALSSLNDLYPHLVIRPREDNFGIGLYSKLALTESEVIFIGDARVPSIVAMANTPGGDIRVVATHPLPPMGRAYSTMRNDQLASLPSYLDSDIPVLLLGDLNTTPWNYSFRRLIAQSGLRDSARGFGVQPTWPNVIPLFRIPIDHCLHSPDIMVIDRSIGNNASSDHYPLIIDFVIETHLAAKP